MESLPSFSEHSMPILDFLTKSSQIVVPNLPQTSQKNSDVSSDTKSPYPQHTTLKPTEKQRDSTRRLRPTSTSFAVLTLKLGLTTSPWTSSSTTTALTPPPVNPHFTSCSAMNHKPSQHHWNRPPPSIGRTPQKPWHITKRSTCCTQARTATHEKLDQIQVHPLWSQWQSLAQGQKP